MRTRLFRITLFGILALACLDCAFLFGYARGHRAAVRDNTEFGIVYNLSLYKLEQDGDTNRLADKLRFMVYGYSDYYDRYFSNKVVTNGAFFNRLAEARVIASQMRTQVVNVDSALKLINDELRTNRGPSMELDHPVPSPTPHRSPDPQ